LPTRTADKRCLLLADIGGTHARFALGYRDRVGYSAVATLHTGDYGGIGDAIDAYLAGAGMERPEAICVAAAGPLRDDGIHLTNGHWVIAEDDLTRLYGTSQVRLVNDFEAVAHAIPFLAEAEVIGVGSSAPRLDARADFTIGIIGPGTGLGAAGLLRRDGRLVPLPGEAGHTGFAPQTPEQFEVLAVLREAFQPVTIEHLLSGPGILNLAGALARLHGAPLPANTAAELFAASAAGDTLAADTVRVFFEVLGQVAGDFALLLGARDGIYIAGGIVPRYPALLAASEFRNAFDHKGVYRELMAHIPTALVVHPDPGLLGASAIACELSGGLSKAPML